MREIEQRAVEAYKENFGEDPEKVASAPGRVNLIGEHTDYNDGYVLPCAVERRVAVAIGRGGDGLYSADFGEKKPVNEKREGSWSDYPRGVAWALRGAGYELESFRAAIAGNVPLGSGLSSSAAIEASTALALDALFGLGMDRKEMAALCMKAENEFVGLQSGIMDQYASLLCEAGAALFIDCRSLVSERVPLDLEPPGLALLVCDTRVQHGPAETGYNERREECERAAKNLGVEKLRDAREEDLEMLDGKERQRARHVVTENARTLAAVEALGEEDFGAFGRLMYESHRSMRDDFEMSTPEIDTVVEVSEDSGALGARLTGGGFGGCAIVLARAREAGGLREKIQGAFTGRGFEAPVFYEFLPVAGAEVIL
ncbi:MAG: galactokinase [Rubrobacteraceae bacterium]